MEIVMSKGWHNEFERHSLARQGIKTAVDKPKSYVVPKPRKTTKREVLLSYNDSDIYESEKERITQDLKEQGAYEEDLDEEVERRLNNADYQWYWDDFKESLTYEMKERNPDGYWAVEGRNLNWRGASGEKTFQATTGEDLIEAIAPKTSDFSIDVSKNGKNGLHVVIYHHDCPTGSIYDLHKISKAQYDKENGDY